MLHGAYLDQLASRYDLDEELAQVGHRPQGSLARGEMIVEDCMSIHLFLRIYRLT